MNFIKVFCIGLLSLAMIQCTSTKKKESIPAPAIMPTVSTPATPASPPQTDSTKELNELKISLKKAEAIVKSDLIVAEAKHDSATPHSASPMANDHHRLVGKVDSEKALGWLKNGNIRYLKGFHRKDGAAKKDIERLATGQSPHSIILSCSDSRVPPEIVFDQKLGEVFVIRTAGQSLDSAVIASIEYAVKHLGSNLILVMGHTSCGAVKATLDTPIGSDTGSPYINALVAEVQPRLAAHRKGPASENLTVEGWDNARGVTQKLLEKSKVIREAAKSGSLRLETALYHLKSGQVEWNK